MMGGGVPEGDSLLIAGPSGSGKSVVATHFIAQGLRLGEPAIVAIFEERPEEYPERAANLGMDFATPLQAGKLNILYLRPLDLRSMRRCTRSSTRWNERTRSGW